MVQTGERTIRDRSAGGSDRRSAELIEARVQASLQDSCYQTIRRLQFKLLDGVLTLHGRVSSYYYKQLAQELVRSRWKGALVIRNEVEVVTGEVAGLRPHEAGETRDQIARLEAGVVACDDGY
jgi:hypothetical protein